MNAENNQELSLERIGPRSMGNWKDRLGIFASVACAIHCAATPILLASLPALKFTEWMASPLFHQIAALVCCGIVAIAIWPSFMRFRDYRILSLSSLGLGLIVSAAFFGPEDCCTRDLRGVKTVALRGQAPVESDGCSDSCCQKDATVQKTELAHNDSHAADDGHDHGHSHSHVHDHEHSHGESQTATMQMAGISAIQPWMTPLGGVLLIAAHGLNLRRRTCASVTCKSGC